MHSLSLCVVLLIFLLLVYFCCFKVSNVDYPVVEDIMKLIVKEKQTFERLELRKEDLLEMFKVNYKARSYIV
jgi:threonyl-tRNA synthetase